MPTRKIMDKNQLIENLKQLYGNKVTSSDIRGFCASNGYNYQTVTYNIDEYKVSRGCWNLEVTKEKVDEIERSYSAPSYDNPIKESMVPKVDEFFVSHGNFKYIKNIIKSNIFFPLFITGLSGNGKTYFTEQACAQLNRELVRVNITIETDEDDLIGGFRLSDGNTVWSDGPVVEAMRRGAILLLDEIDLASNKIMCLQSILEGGGLYLKKINSWVTPTPGFNIIATANTKGKGSDDGRFAGTNVLNEAFLERFPITLEQDYPTPSIEMKILKRHCDYLGITDSEEFCKCLTNWSDVIRKTFEEGAVDELISTRRLVHIIKAYKIYNDKMDAIKLCINRFDTTTKQAFIELYDKVDIDFKTDSDEQVNLDVVLEGTDT